MAAGSSEIARDGDVAIRLMRDEPSDYALVVRWRNEPHVREFWDPDDPPMTLDTAMAELRPAIRGEDADTPCVIEVDGAPIGFVQFSPWSAWEKELREAGVTVPDGAWTLDIYIGERDWIDRGVGRRVVRLVCDHLFASHGATAVSFGVEVLNARGRRAYEMAGMTPTVEFLDTDTRGGQRVRSIMMLRMAPGADGSVPPTPSRERPALPYSDLASGGAEEVTHLG